MSDKISKILCPDCGKHLDISDLDAFFVFNCPRCGTLLHVPKKFGSYYLDRLCGSGGMGEVYFATEMTTGKRFALKIAMPQIAEEAKACFDNECALLKDISHPNLIGIYGSSIINDCAVLLMEFVEGENFYTRLQRGDLPRGEQIRTLLIDAAKALSTMHQHQIVHHDIKPENFIAKTDGHLVLCDFDLADRRADDDDTTPCRDWGSLDYASPERLLHGAESYRGDIFSLGASFYELITGRQPFGAAEDQQSHYDLRRNQMFDLPDMFYGISPQICTLITDMLNFAPEARPDYPEIFDRLGI